MITIFSEGYFDEIYDIDKMYVCHMQENHEDGVTTPAHRHDFVEILYGVDCQCSIYVDNMVYEFKSNELIIFNSKQVHKIISNGKMTKYICVRFKIDVIYMSKYSSLELEYVLPFLLSDTKNKVFFTEEDLKGTGVPELMWEIYNETQRKEYAYEIGVTAILHKLYLFFLRQWNNKEDWKNKNNYNEELEGRLLEVFSYIEKNYQGEISSHDIARRCHVSYSYFSRWFKKVTGKTFIQYVNYIRISHAERLLMDGECNITEISMQTGFATTSYFIKQFKIQKGCTPGEFRKQFADDIKG